MKTLVLSVLTITLWRQHVLANIPLYSTDVPADKRGETIQLLQKNLLRILGMRERPRRPKADAYIPQHMLDLYERQTNDPDHVSMFVNKESSLHANTVRSFPHLGR